MKKKTILISAVVVVVLSLVGVYYYRLQNKAKVYYWRSVSVERGDVNVLVTATGTMAADTSVDVGVQVSGTIAKITAHFNDVVKKGQVIAILDNTLYELASTAYQTAKSNITSAQAQLNRAAINLRYYTVKAPISARKAVWLLPASITDTKSSSPFMPKIPTGKR